MINRRTCALAVVVGLLYASTTLAQSGLEGETIRVSRATTPIVIDGSLSDEAWQHATRVDKWYEVRPGDNIEPPVKNVGYLTFDDQYFYAGFEFEDPNPSAIRAPFTDRDNIGHGFTDYGGVLIDAQHTGNTATFFVVTPHNIQYDAISDDASGEDSSPDFFWQSAARINDHGWTLEMRIPFSSLRYRNVDPQTWGIILYRNYPRDYRYQFFSAKLPRDSNCFVCRYNQLVGLERLPSGGHLVAAPYVSASQSASSGDVVGSPLHNEPVDGQVGLDAKWTPNADNVLDVALKPDFSQVESDTAQIAANERFALFYPEKRPFFLEGVDLLQTPIQAVYTRTITAPRWGSRVTGKEAGVRYTVLVADDAGGGTVVLPGPNDSSTAPQDFGSTVLVARAKRYVGLSFLGLLVTDREVHNGPDHNRVAGPDFQWRPSGNDVVSGQWLFTDTRTPNRPDLAPEWTGQAFAGAAGTAQWVHNTTHLDWFGMYRDVTSGFRADTGFVPQVGYREGYGQTGWTVYPTGFFRRVRTFMNVDYQEERDGALITRSVTPGVGMDARFNGFMQFRYIDERDRAGGVVIGRRQFGYIAQFSPSRRVSQISLNGTTGEEIDFANARPGHGTTLNLTARVNPTDHLEVEMVQNQRWVNVKVDTPVSRRLFTAHVSRIRGTYTFTSQFFVRAIAQYVATDRDPSLYVDQVDATTGDFSSSLLIAYKLNWQSVMFVGYGDDRTLATVDRVDRLVPASREFFVKLSYAFQR